MRTIVLLLSSILYLNAMSMQDAVDLTLKANQTIKEQEYILNESKYNIEISKSQFYPTVDLSYTRNDKKNSINNTDKMSTNIKYNLFNGFSDFYNINSTIHLYNAQDYYLASVKEDISLLVKTAYINILRQKQNVEVAKQSKELLEEQRRESLEFYKVGFIPKNDLLAVEVELNKSIQNLLSAKSLLNYYMQTLQRYTRTKIYPDDIKELKLTTPTLSETLLKDKMLLQRSEIAYLNEIIESKNYNIKSAIGNFMPDINISAEYINYQDNHLNTNIESKSNDYSVELQVNFNIFNGFRDKYTLELNKLNKLISTSQKINLIEDLELQLFNALENYNLALNAYEVSKIALEQAEENYRISKNRYKERIMSTSDFLDAEFLLTEARSNMILNRYSIIQNLIEIERITQSKIN